MLCPCSLFPNDAPSCMVASNPCLQTPFMALTFWKPEKAQRAELQMPVGVGCNRGG